MSTHTVTYALTIRSEDMDGSPDETAEVFDMLIRDAFDRLLACDLVDLQVTECGEE